MNKKLIIAMAITSMLMGCKCKEKAAEPKNGGNETPQLTQNTPKTMPEGRLLRVTYSYQGMRMEMFSNFDLQRLPEGSKLSFRHYNNEVSYEVNDTLLDAARRIIEEEHMYEYDSYYSMKMEGRILDGDRWDFDAKFEGNQRISSGGRNASPKGDGLHKISKLLNDAARRLVEADKQP